MNPVAHDDQTHHFSRSNTLKQLLAATIVVATSPFVLATETTSVSRHSDTGSIAMVQWKNQSGTTVNQITYWPGGATKEIHRDVDADGDFDAYRVFFENGVEKHRALYASDGHPAGQWIWRNANGDVLKERDYTDLNGTVAIYSAGLELRDEFTYIDRVPNGPQTRYLDGNVEIHRSMVNGQWHGEHKRFVGGVLVETGLWENGKRVE